MQGVSRPVVSHHLHEPKSFAEAYREADAQQKESERALARLSRQHSLNTKPLLRRPGAEEMWRACGTSGRPLLKVPPSRPSARDVRGRPTRAGQGQARSEPAGAEQHASQESSRARRC
eukprot:3497317-Alexandrium_andersonii.AAC.1